MWFAERKNSKRLELKRIELVENLKVLSTKAEETLESTRFEAEQLAKTIKDKKYCAILGKGLWEPIAREAALKIKEVTYIHADGYSSGEFKHGPLALIEENKSCVGIVYVLDDENFESNLAILSTLKAKEAYTIAITNWKQNIPSTW